MMYEQELPDRQLIYDALRKEDLAQVVLTTLNILKQNNLITSPSKYIACKSITLSEQCRSEGNTAYKHAKYQHALELYNKALLFAPKKTPALALAYSNRSALLYTMKLYKPCLKDIKICLELECPPHVIQKLKKRKKDAETFLWKYDIESSIRESFTKEFLNLGTKHPRIPCASSDIDAVVESGIPKVIAARSVDVGAILAIEKAFHSSVEKDYKYTACYYCQNVNPNLIPCDGCCEALFCNENCKEKCMAEYHSIECEILHNDLMPIVQATIKLKNLFSSWKEFTEASNLLSSDRIKQSDIDQIFNGENKLSMLNFYQERHFWHGRVFNFSLKFARTISYLIDANKFFPKQREEKLNAITSFSRVLMYMSMNIPYLNIMCAVSVMAQNKNELVLSSLGMFPLLGKLPHSCDPNVLMIGLNNRMALVAIKPLAPGTKLTVSYAGHRLDYTTDFRQDSLLIRYGVCCQCNLCRGIPWMTDTKPTEAQMRVYHKLNPKGAMENLDLFNIFELLRKSIKVLTILSDLPFSQEYMDVYTLFRKCLLNIQDASTNNYILDTPK